MSAALSAVWDEHSVLPFVFRQTLNVPSRLICRQQGLVSCHAQCDVCIELLYHYNYIDNNYFLMGDLYGSLSVTQHEPYQ